MFKYFYPSTRPIIALFIVFLLLATFTGLVSNVLAQGQASRSENGELASPYDMYCGLEEYADSGYTCPTHRQSYLTSILQDGMIENGFLAICGKTMDEAINPDDNYCIDTMAVLGYGPNAQKYAEIRENGRGTGSITTIMGQTYASLINEPPVPTDLALYINDITSDTLLGTDANAQAVFQEQLFQSVVLSTWKVTRDISLALFGVILGITALMIMFRSKISPNAVATIYNTLPMVLIVLPLILLSYLIITFMMSFIGPLTNLAINVGLDITEGVWDSHLSTVTGEADLTRGAKAAAGFYENMNRIIAWVRDAWGWFVGSVIGGLGLLIVTLITFFILLWNLGSIIGSLILNTILSPLIILSGLIPGKQGVITNLGKKIMVDVVTFPVIVLGFFIVVAILGIQPQASDTSVTSNVVGLLGFDFLVYLIKFFIAIGLALKLGSIRNNLLQMIGTNPGYLGMGGGDAKRR